MRACVLVVRPRSGSRAICLGLQPELAVDHLDALRVRLYLKPLFLLFELDLLLQPRVGALQLFVLDVVEVGLDDRVGRLVVFAAAKAAGVSVIVQDRNSWRGAVQRIFGLPWALGALKARIHGIWPLQLRLSLLLDLADYRFVGPCWLGLDERADFVVVHVFEHL